MGTFMEYFNAFWVGGLICALCQILLDRTKMLPGRIMVTLVCTGAVLSFLGLYDPFAEYAGKQADMLEADGIVLENGRVNLKKYGINVEEMLAQRELEQN